MVPTGYVYTKVYTIRDAKRMARQNHSVNQYFYAFIPSENNAPGLNPMHRVKYSFTGRKWVKSGLGLQS